MIDPTPMFMLVCDRCKEHWTDADQTICAMFDADDIESRAIDDEWKRGHDVGHPTGTHYCPDCYEPDGADGFRVKASK